MMTSAAASQGLPPITMAGEAREVAGARRVAELPAAAKGARCAARGAAGWERVARPEAAAAGGEAGAPGPSTTT